MLACVLTHVCTVSVLTCLCSYKCVIVHVGDGKQALDVACGFFCPISDFHVEPAASFMDTVSGH